MVNKGFWTDFLNFHIHEKLIEEKKTLIEAHASHIRAFDEDMRVMLLILKIKMSLSS